MAPLIERLAQALTPREVAEAVCEEAVRMLGVTASGVMALEDGGETLELLATVGLPVEDIEPWARLPVAAPTPNGEAVRTGEPVLLSDREQLRERYPELDGGVLAVEGARVSLPLVVEGRAQGVMGLTFAEPREFGAEERELLGLVAHTCAQALWRALSFERERQARRAAEAAQRRLQFLAGASALLDRSLQERTTMEQIAELCVPDLGDLAVIDLLTPDGQIRGAVAAASADPAHGRALEELRQRFPLSATGPHPVSRVLRTGRSVLLPELSVEVLDGIAVSAEHRRFMEMLRYRSAIVAPLRARDRTSGALSVLHLGDGPPYDEEDLRLVEELASRAAMALDNARMYEERSRIAQTLEQSLRPPAEPAVPGLELAARYRPSGEGNEVGGDFYDVFPLGEQTWGMVIGDVCGKGAEAAALTAVARHTVRAVAGTGRPPDLVLSSLNQAVMAQSSDHRFLTAVYARITLGGGPPRVVLAAGGHPRPLLLSGAGSVREMGSPGTLIGIFPGADFPTCEHELLGGEALVLYTDGLTDAGAPRRPLGVGGLQTILGTHAGMDADALADAALRAALSHQGHGGRDDIALLVVRNPG